MTLSEIIENGETILRLLRNAKNGKKIDDSLLLTHLLNQATRIKRIKSLIKKSKISTIFKIHLPELKDMKILIEMKGDRIALFTEQINTQTTRRLHPVPVDFQTISSYMGWRGPKLVLPSETILRNTRQNLKELKELSDLLRQFLVEKFEIDEII